MNGHVLQTLNEARILGQFNKSLEALKIPAATESKKKLYNKYKIKSNKCEIKNNLPYRIGLRGQERHQVLGYLI